LARPDGNLGQADLLGALLAMAMPLAVDRARWNPWWLAAAGLCALGLVASGARSGWLGALVGLCTFAVFRVSARRVRWALGAAVAAVAVAVAIGLLSPLRSLNHDTGSGRVGVWRDTLSVVAARPLTGWGEDSFGVVFGRFQTGDWSPGQSFDRAHSMPLDLAASQGLLGLAACSWFFLLVWRGLWRKPQVSGLAGAMAAYLAWSLLNFDWAPASGPFWALAGVAWAAAGGPSPRQKPATSARLDEGEASLAPTRWWRPALAAAGAVVALALVVPVQIADVVYFLGHPDRAAALDPLQPHYQAAVGDLAGLQRAAALNDPDPTTYVSLGDVLRAARQPEEAQAAYLPLREERQAASGDQTGRGEACLALVWVDQAV
jgi:O-Antigen ligase